MAVVLAFIMAKVESSKSREVLNRVKKLEGVQEAYIIYGAYNLLLKALFKTPEALSSFVVDTLRKIDGIRDTVTNVCATCD